MEDIDAPRVVTGADHLIMQQLQALGMHWDAPPVWQSRRLPHYTRAFDALKAQGQVYGCACTRAQIGRRAYPGTCRNGIAHGQTVRAWRFRLPDAGGTGDAAHAPNTFVHFQDRWLGPQQQNVASEVGDFIVRRADGLWAYQFVVVIDDGEQGITDIVRGADLLTSTARQQVLAQYLGLLVPRVMHVPLVVDGNGNKLSKQNHAPALDSQHPLTALQLAWQHLGFAPLAGVASVAQFWPAATAAWAQRFGTP